MTFSGSPMNLAQKLSEYVVSIEYSDIPQEVIYEAKKRIVDGLGCAIGAFKAEPVAIAKKLAGDVKSNRGSFLLGTRRKAPADIATFINGIMVRYFDYNDTYLSKEPAHPSDNIGQSLSVADAERRSGKD